MWLVLAGSMAIPEMYRFGKPVIVFCTQLPVTFEARPRANGVSRSGTSGLHGPHQPAYVTAPRTASAVPTLPLPKANWFTHDPDVVLIPAVLSHTWFPRATMWFLLVGSRSNGAMNLASAEFPPSG